MDEVQCAVGSLRKENVTRRWQRGGQIKLLGLDPTLSRCIKPVLETYLEFNIFSKVNMGAAVLRTFRCQAQRWAFGPIHGEMEQTCLA